MRVILSYVYLHAGTEAVVIAGPDVASASGLFTLMTPNIDLIGATDFSAGRYTVTVNSELGYRVAIADFEYEVTLARVELSEVGQVIQSRFVFGANPTASGVAHDITITATGARRCRPPRPSPSKFAEAGTARGLLLAPELRVRASARRDGPVNQLDAPDEADVAGEINRAAAQSVAEGMAQAR